MIPNEVREEHLAICEKCGLRKKIAKMVDAHFDWIDCPYDCENDYEHWKKGKMRDLIDRQKVIKIVQTNPVVEALGKIEKMPTVQLSPCDICVYAPPSSMDGKPCCMCPAEGRE